MSEYDAETIRAHLREQICPWCGRGPFKSLPGHTSRAHGVFADDLREMAGYPSRVSTVSAELTELKQEVYKDIGQPLHRTEVRAACRESIEASEKHRLARLKNIQEFNDAGGLNEEQRQRAAASYRQRHLQETAERDAEMVRMYESGATISEVAEHIGIHAKSVTDVLRRRGAYREDGRTRYHRRRRGQDTPELRLGRAASSERSRETRERRVMAYMGGEPVARIAAREGVDPKVVSGQLREEGCPVPDGRGGRVLVRRPCTECFALFTPRTSNEQRTCGSEECRRSSLRERGRKSAETRRLKYGTAWVVKR